MSRSVLRAGLLAISLCAATAQDAHADTFTDPAGRFVIDVPAGWVAESSSDVAMRDTLAGISNPSRNWHYVGAFVPAGELTDASPYVIVQWTEAPLGKLTWDQLASEFSAENMDAAMREAEGQMAYLFGNLDLGRPVLDRERGRLLLRMELPTPNGPMGVSSTGFLGNDGIAQIHCYAMKDDMERASKDFDAVVSGFRFDAGEVFTGEGGGLDWGAIARRGLIFGVIGGIIGLLVANNKRNKRGVPRRGRTTVDGSPSTSARKRPASRRRRS